jgi:hypothetical protein
MSFTRDKIARLIVNQTGSPGDLNYVYGQVETASRLVLNTLGQVPSKKRVVHDEGQAVAVLDEIEARLALGSLDIKKNLGQAGISVAVLRRTEAVIRGL